MRPTPTYIAVIDDDESFCRSTERLLRAARYQPVVYASAESFLADVKHPRFDILLIDIALGGISGLELGRRLAAVGSTVPVIYVTAHDSTQTRAQAQATGCAGFVNKTEPPSHLLQLIAEAIGQSH
jgi:FixJ family two-component response regulator